MSEYTPYTGTIPGCRMRMVRVMTAKLKEHDILTRFAKNIDSVTAWKELRGPTCGCLQIEATRLRFNKNIKSEKLGVI